jgi:hypothetical protein
MSLSSSLSVPEYEERYATRNEGVQQSGPPKWRQVTAETSTPVRVAIPLCQNTSAYVSISQHTSAFVSIRQHTSAYDSIRQTGHGGRRRHTFLSCRREKWVEQ